MGMGKTAGDTSEGESAEKASEERAPEGKDATKAAGKRTAAKKAATEAGEVVTLQGPGFSFEVPAKWTVYAGEAADGRPVAATDKKYKSIGNAESGSGKCTMALYRGAPENDLDDEGTFGSILAKYGTPDMRYIGMVKYYRLPLSVDKEDRVAANAAECLVLRMPSPITPDNYVEYYIRPLAMRTNDLLRIVARDYNKNLDMDAVHALVLQIASSVKLTETDVPECVRDFERLLAEPATAEKVNEVMADYMLPYLDKTWDQLDFVSDMIHRAKSLCPDGDDAAAAKQFCARSMIEFSNRRFAQLLNFVDVIEKQRELGAEPAELRQMVKECQEYGLCMGVSGEDFDSAERTAMQRDGVLGPCPDCLAWRERMDKLAQELDLRDCMSTLSGKPFDVSFVLARNFDVDQYFDWPSSSSRPVSGAQENPGTLHVTEQPVIDLTVEKKPAAKKASEKAEADEKAVKPAKRATAKKPAAKAEDGEEAVKPAKKAPAKKTAAKAGATEGAEEATAPAKAKQPAAEKAPAKKKSAAKAKAGEESQAEATDAKQAEKKSPAKKRSAKAEADEKTAPKVQESAEKDEVPAKPKTVEQAILTLKDQLKSAEAAVLPFDAKKLEELKTKLDEAKRELDNAGFFAFFKKKELKERIAKLEAEIPPLEKAQRTHQAVEDIKKKLKSTEEAAEKEYKSRGLI